MVQSWRQFRPKRNNCFLSVFGWDESLEKKAAGVIHSKSETEQR